MITATEERVAYPHPSRQEERELLLYFHALNRARVQAVDNEGRELLRSEARRIREMIL